MTMKLFSAKKIDLWKVAAYLNHLQSQVADKASEFSVIEGFFISFMQHVNKNLTC